MADLAEHLGINPRHSISDLEDPTREPELTLAEFCHRRKMDMRQLTETFQVVETTYMDRPALRFPTRIGVDRIKYLDRGQPKYGWAGTGGKAHWYGLGAAIKLAGRFIYIVNGEPSVWSCAQAGVPAVCMCAGEGASPSDEMIAVLGQQGVKSVRVVYDLDEPGRTGATRVVRKLTSAGIDAAALELPGHLGRGGDVDDLHRLVGDEGFADELAGLPELVTVETVPESISKEPAWPTLSRDALYGLVGEIVDAISPHTESDPVAVLCQFLIAFGSCSGRDPHFMVEADRHGCNESAVLVGNTSRGRKGTSWGHVKRLFLKADPSWSGGCIANGLSSGEGLIWAVRDPVTKMRTPKGGGPAEEVVEDEGISDKRLFVIESEYASVLKVMSRRGNTLSPVIRDAWDGHSLRSLTKNCPARATDPHISILGHITSTELRNLMTETEAANGYGNRVLWICVRRSKLLPEGGCLDGDGLSWLVRRLGSALDHARCVGELRRDPEARAAWREVYPTLSADHPGLYGAMIARAEAHVTRLSLLYALLDGSSSIRTEHLIAALAFWQYAEDSARFIFNDALGDPLADRIVELIRSNPAGMSQTKLHDAFNNNISASRINSVLSHLESLGLVVGSRQETGGRPAHVWCPVRK